MRRQIHLLVVLLFVVPLFAFKSVEPSPSSPTIDETQVVVINASTKEERTIISSAGVSIEEVHNGFIVGLCHQKQIEALTQKGFQVQVRSLPNFLLDFPPDDSAFHNLQELNSEMQALAKAHSDIMSLSSIGKSIEKRDLVMARISGPQNKVGDKPAMLFLGTHHAREHLSTEVPFYLIKYLVENYGTDQTVTHLVNDREIWIIPLVNPDGASYDIETSQYKWWRKNRQGNGTKNIFGVDLNRNYGFKWGGEGAGTSPDSETYRGSSAFSEPETQSVKAFIESHTNITTLLSYHTFSELILYPWGYKYDSIENQSALKVHETMAQNMARMTGYTPQQSSDLYVTSGDTTDWAFGEHKIISFTFELYPSSMMDGGFYPSDSKIQEVVKNNLPPALYLTEYADNPYRVVTNMKPRDFLTVNDIWPPRLQDVH